MKTMMAVLLVADMVSSGLTMEPDRRAAGSPKKIKRANNRAELLNVAQSALTKYELEKALNATLALNISHSMAQTQMEQVQAKVTSTAETSEAKAELWEEKLRVEDGMDWEKVKSFVAGQQSIILHYEDGKTSRLVCDVHYTDIHMRIAEERDADLIVLAFPSCAHSDYAAKMSYVPSRFAPLMFPCPRPVSDNFEALVIVRTKSEGRDIVEKRVMLGRNADTAEKGLKWSINDLVATKSTKTVLEKHGTRDGMAP